MSDRPRMLIPTGLYSEPYNPNGTETRSEIICAALWDAREFHPEMNVGDLAAYVNVKLEFWERAKERLSEAPG